MAWFQAKACICKALPGLDFFDGRQQGFAGGGRACQARLYRGGGWRLLLSGASALPQGDWGVLGADSLPQEQFLAASKIGCRSD
ncbi:hypothetical protein DYL59_25065 [Pseudomonas kairouanensis]|uniref:Uncharacterized protein n=1 Tax=Pseudomonas kairouanensis TaxID=2293832 RepID=A0A4Z0AG34_9PSED|nr:hypothetical protein DYL59_25065 [Pseudomonas kairouanensis]